MNQEERFYPVPEFIAEYLTGNGYTEDRVNADGQKGCCFQLENPEIPLAGLRVYVDGYENELTITATLDTSGPLLFGGQKRAIRYAITYDEFIRFKRDGYWKYQLNQILEKMALSLFLPLFNLHKADQNGHLVIK